jgi:hypothetical protein
MTGCSTRSSRPAGRGEGDHIPRRVARWWTRVQGCSDEQHLDGSGHRHTYYRLARQEHLPSRKPPIPWEVFSFPGTPRPGEPRGVTISRITGVTALLPDNTVAPQHQRGVTSIALTQHHCLTHCLNTIASHNVLRQG